ncbi:MAG TPA: class I SAM-dependent methyltransferase [Candidatus Polarisedimenticolia bacterium]|nr:class I SAM-dependent methyltransferase [Candidatus Polarisedimenticolia bacterium]
MGDDRRSVVRRFEQEAGAFAESPVHRDPVRLQRLVAWAAPRGGERALDVACGPGIVLRALAATGAFVVGIDLTGAMLREARGSGGALVAGDAAILPFADAAFDLVVMRNATHHIASPGPVFSECARVLRPGGRFVHEDMAAAEDLRERDFQETIERLRDSAHARTLPPSETRGLVASAGLRLEREEVFLLSLDFDEWVDRPRPSAPARARARWLMERRQEKVVGSLRSWIEAGRLRFERPSLLLRAVRP